MTKSLPILLGSLLLLCGCASQTPHTAAPTSSTTTSATSTPPISADDNLNAVAWTQTALEHDLIYQETFRGAQSQLLAALKDKHWDALPSEDRVVPYKNLKPAVIL